MKKAVSLHIKIISTMFYCIKTVFETSKLYVLLFAFEKIFCGIKDPLGIFLKGLLILNLSALFKERDLALLAHTCMIGFVYWLLNYSTRLYGHFFDIALYDRLEPQISIKLINKFNKKIIDEVNFQEFEDAEFKNNMNYVNGMAQNISSAFKLTFDIIENAIGFALILSIIIWIEWWLAIPVLLCVFMLFKFRKKVTEKKFHLRYTLFPNNILLNHVSNILTSDEFVEEIKVFDSMDYLLKKWKSTGEKTIEGTLKLERKIMPYTILYNVISLLGSFLCTAVALAKFFGGHGSVAQISMAIDTSSNASNYVDAMTQKYSEAYGICMEIWKGKEVLEKIDESAKNKINIDEITINEIRFENVYFSYKKDENYALKDISMKISAGDYVALAGKNGSGKTTLCMLICGLYSPTKGIIYYNGIPHYDIYFPQIQNKCSLMFQDYFKYALSVSDNIVFDEKENINKERFGYATGLSNVDDFAESLPERYDTLLIPEINENALNLSIGQWQRLSCARALYKKSNIILMDEPASALDTYAEKNIYNSIQRHNECDIKVIITHQLSCLKNTSRVILIENGQISADSCFLEMMKYDNEFSRLYNKKYAYFKSLSNKKSRNEEK